MFNRNVYKIYCFKVYLQLKLILKKTKKISDFYVYQLKSDLFCSVNIRKL